MHCVAACCCSRDHAHLVRSHLESNPLHSTLRSVPWNLCELQAAGMPPQLSARVTILQSEMLSWQGLLCVYACAFQVTMLPHGL